MTGLFRDNEGARGRLALCSLSHGSCKGDRLGDLCGDTSGVTFGVRKWSKDKEGSMTGRLESVNSIDPRSGNGDKLGDLSGDLRSGPLSKQSSNDRKLVLGWDVSAQ